MNTLVLTEQQNHFILAESGEHLTEPHMCH